MDRRHALKWMGFSLAAAAPKIFFRYYLVNGSTGEKSQSMLAEVKWAPAAAGGGEP